MRKVESAENDCHHDQDDEFEIVKIYTLSGPLLFSNSNRLSSIFNWNGDPDSVEVHLQNCTVYDFTAMNQLNKIAEKYRKKDKQIHLKHINIATMKSLDKARELVPHFTFQVEVDVDDKQQFSKATRLNVAQGSNRQL